MNEIKELEILFTFRWLLLFGIFTLCLYDLREMKKKKANEDEIAYYSRKDKQVLDISV